MDAERLSEAIDYRFRNEELLVRALTHSSFGAAHNERLEFLGDSVLNCVVALELYSKFPGLTEGELSRLRASLVSQPSLAAAAAAHGLGLHLRLGEGERKTGGARRPSVLADALEAVVGAAFLDGGFEAARTVVRRLFGEALARIDPATTGKDPKTRLQEYLHSRRLPLPQYSIVATRGEAHELVFRVECEIAALGVRTHGEGPSRRSAEQEAARAAYERATQA
jgi:ribonuclease-3